LVIGSERTPAEYVAKLVDVGREIWRVLRDDGTLWLNLGDGYQNAKGQAGGVDPKQPARRHGLRPQDVSIPGLKPKDLIGIPWLVAFALQADGWYLRDAIIWAKAEVDEDNNLDGSVMPGSQEDRCTSAYEMLFMLSKSARYYWDGEPLRAQSGAWPRNVWRINTQGCAKAHFAVFPKKLVEPCILAGTSEEGCCPGCGAPWRRVTEKTRIKRRRPNDRTSRHEAGNGVNSCGNTVAGVDVKTIGWKPTCKCDAGKAVPCTVLDPFMGTGTTAEVARQFGRRAIGCELSGEYMDMAKARFPQAGLFDAPKYEEAK
jgi:DNA modification methylase